MTTPLEFLSQRYSCGKLGEPGPNAGEVEQLLSVGLRAPDHGGIKPWHFIVMTGAGRERLGRIFAKAVSDNGADETKIEKATNMPLRAPCVIAVICKYKQHPKVPWIEQVQSAGCSLFSMQQAALAMGYSGIWRTGELARDEYVRQSLSLEKDDELVGFLYLGTETASNLCRKPIPHEKCVSYWD